MKKIYAILAVAVLFAACDKESIRTDVGNTTEYPVLKASIASTKTVIDGTTVSFEVGDEITVFNGVKGGSNHLAARYACTAISGGIATFAYTPDTEKDDLEIVPDAELDNVVATYPFRSTTTGVYEEYGAGTAKIRMVAGPIDATTGFATPSLPVIASAAKGELLEFKHTAGLFKVNIKGTAKIATVTMTSDQNINAEAKVNYADAAPALTVMGTGKTNTYRYNHDSETGVTAGLQLNESTGVDFYFGLPVGTHTLKFVFTDTDGKTMTRTAAGVVITRGGITPSKSSLVYAPDVLPTVDLTEGSKYANCYVIKAKGNYSFDAKRPDGTAVVGTKAAWVWATSESCSAGTAAGTALPAKLMSDIAYADGKVTFSVPEGYEVGNVCIAVLNESNEIQYTWHVWLTSDDIADLTVQGIKVMDRNLGAGAKFDVAVAANAPLQTGKGCFYQWGRKDPFPGGRNSAAAAGENPPFLTNNSQHHAINTEVSGITAFAFAIDLGGTTVEDGAKNPCSMAAAGKVPGAGDAGTDWSERANANPCPYGYRPISSAEVTTLHDAADPVISNYNNFGQVNLGGLVLARSGYRGGTDGKAKEAQGNSSTARYWTNTVSSGTQGVYMKVTWGSNTALAASWWTLTGFNANHALNVRCVKE